MTQHSTFVDIDGRLCLANEDDPYYMQVFASADEYFAFIERLIADGNKHFGVAYLLDGECAMSNRAGALDMRTLGDPLNPSTLLQVDDNGGLTMGKTNVAERIDSE